MFTYTKESFAKKEEKILDFWEMHRIFEKSLEQRAGAPLFSFYDGPPFATGLPHYGHILAGTIKDVIPRYKTMKGFYVPRRFGWDCHGLPVENEIEKEYKLHGAAAIESFGIKEFNEACRSIVLRYTQEWKRSVTRLGRFVQFEEPYRTMDLSFMESVWWVFGELWDRGLVYEGVKVMPFSTQLGTPLSNFEANLNYKDVDDPSLMVGFSLKEEPAVRLLVWTTTPWTLPSNLAILVKRDLLYVKVQCQEGVYVMAFDALARVLQDKPYQILEEFFGEKLLGRAYEPLFPYFCDHEHAFVVIEEESVSKEEGTGLVHAAPAFGEVDFYACARQGITPVCPIDVNGCFTQEVAAYVGMYVKHADREIIQDLKKQGRVFHHGQIHHRYPFCWRSDTPLIYRTVRTWFVAVEKIKDRLLHANEQIHWVPEHIQHGRFGKWLEHARDWAISRNRYWGTPIPIWRSETGKIRVMHSVKELEERAHVHIEDIHRHHIDALTFEEEGEVFHRIPEVFDCWFESGSVPYAQYHYPFENKEIMKQAFPADFIGEGLDQTRGWFYTLTVLSVALFDKPAFQNVIVNGILLAEDGNKMSKRLKNYPEPDLVFAKHGADAVRLYLLGSPAVVAEDLRFSEADVEKVARQFLFPLWNSFVFFATYAQIIGWQPHEMQPTAEIDRWILSLLQGLISEVTEAMDQYELHRAIIPIGEFIEQLTNWYIRRNRSRFWAQEDSKDRQEGFWTLYIVLCTLVRILAPFAPFISETLYLALRTEQDPISVHLTDFPTEEGVRDRALEKEMELAQHVVKSGHYLRKEHKVRVRQPLACAHLVCAEEEVIKALCNKEHLIAEELNVKRIIYHSKEESFVDFVAKPNFRILGKKVGAKMTAFKDVIEGLDRVAKECLLQGESVTIDVLGEAYTLLSEDVQIVRTVLEGVVAHSSMGITVALELGLTQELIEEGLAREIVSRINALRKELDFAIADRIIVKIQGSCRIQSCLERYREYISQEVLARHLTWEAQLETLAEGISCVIDEENVAIALQVCNT